MNSDRGRELIDTRVFGAEGNVEAHLVSRGPLRLINLTMEMDSILSTLASCYLFIYDCAEDTIFPFTDPTPPPRPIFAPIPIAKGDVASITPQTKWIPFKYGLMIVPSSTENVLTTINFDVTVMVLNTSFHLMLGGC